MRLLNEMKGLLSDTVPRIAVKWQSVVSGPYLDKRFGIPLAIVRLMVMPHVVGMLSGMSNKRQRTNTSVK